MRAGCRRTGSRRNARSHIHSASSPSGRLTQNTHRQENASVTQPPATGPAMLATPHMLAM